MRDDWTARLGNIGETYVLYKLATLGHVAYRTVTGAEAVDVQVVEPRVDIQVKCAQRPQWRFPPSKFDRRGLVVVLLHFDTEAGAMAGEWVVPAQDVHRAGALADAAYLARPTKSGQPRATSSQWEVRAGPFAFGVPGLHPEWLQQYAHAWHVIG